MQQNQYVDAAARFDWPGGWPSLFVAVMILAGIAAIMARAGL